MLRSKLIWIGIASAGALIGGTGTAETVGRPYPLGGAQVCPGGEVPKAIVTMGNRILVVNQEGNVWAHDIGGGVGRPYPLGGAQVCPGGEVPKAIVTMGNRILVVNREGNVWAHDIAD